MKKLLFLLFFCLLAVFVSGIDMCTDRPFVDTECRMVTPSINCSVFNYTVLDSINNVFVDQGNLTLLNDSIYFFNFNEGVGDYLISLCDGTTREVRVGKEDDNMGWLAIGFVLSAITAIFFWISHSMKDKDLIGVKLLFFGLAVVNVFALAFLPLAMTLNPGNVNAYNPVALGYFSVMGISFMAFVWLYGVHLVNNVFKIWMQKRKE